MIESFIVYGMTAAILGILGRFSNKRSQVSFIIGNRNSFLDWGVVGSVFIFSLVSGLRWNVGVDHQHYLRNYLSVQNTGYKVFNFESGFELITDIFAGSGIHYVFYFGFLAFLQIFFVYRTFKDEKYLYPFLGLIIIFGPQYLNWVNGTRQMIAATILFYAVSYIAEKKLLNYLLFVLLASIFHKSSFMMIPLYFIPQSEYFKSRAFLLILAGLTLYLGEDPFWIRYLSEAGTLIDFIGYDNYSDKMDAYVSDVQQSNLGPRRLCIIFTAIVTIWFYPKLKLCFSNGFFLMHFNFSIIGFLAYNILANTHHLLVRPTYYLTLFSVSTSAYLVRFLFYEFSKTIFNYLLSVFISLVFLLSYLPISIIADIGKGVEDYTNYKFFWQAKL